MARLYYIVQSEILTGGVIEAQVIASLRAHSEVAGQPETKLIFLESARVAVSKKARATLKAFRAMWPAGQMQIVPFVGRGGDEAPGKFLAMYLARERLAKSEVVFHCRGPAATLSAAVARRALGKGRIIFDVRGAGSYEVIHRAGFAGKDNLPEPVAYSYNLTLDQERRAVAVADFLFAVSPGLKDYAVYILQASESQIHVVPSCVAGLSFDSEARTTVRRSWGVKEAPVFIYSGRIGRERAPGHLLRLFRSILDFNPESRLVVFSYLNELNSLGELLANAKVPPASVRVESHSRDEVMHLLGAGDAGVLFLEDALRFQDIAAPIKIAEYLSAGLPLVINSAVGRIPDLVRARGLGWIVDQELDDATLRSVAQRILSDLQEKRGPLRQLALDTCSEVFFWRNYVPAIRQAYGFESDARANRLCADTEVA